MNLKGILFRLGILVVAIFLIVYYFLIAIPLIITAAIIYIIAYYNWKDKVTKKHAGNW